MIIHIVGGFLGSGKTTGIISAVKILQGRGVKVSVITNDQGNSLVDSNLMKGSGISFAEVTGGCFCCNYEQLEKNIDFLKKSTGADVIFAESVGSCTDLVATVLKPLMKFRGNEIKNLTFSSFIDSQLLLHYIENASLPFSTDTSYIWHKQLEESDILILNKTDLLNKAEIQKLRDWVKSGIPSDRQILYMNSLETGSVNVWVGAIGYMSMLGKRKSLDIDYNVYGAGEANLAWLDEEIEISSNDGSALMVAHKLIYRLANSIHMNGLPIGHLKFLLNYNGLTDKISYTAVLNRNMLKISTPARSDEVRLLVNARVQTSPEILKSIVESVISPFKSESDIEITEKNVSDFKPGFPKPTHRID
ncbi:MAG TPA: GTP-binding protein [Cyclobacteriaceae bacterium]|nr:GTP-binding protein [Cyclobacteriaceae bacterium]